MCRFASDIVSTNSNLPRKIIAKDSTSKMEWHGSIDNTDFALVFQGNNSSYRLSFCRLCAKSNVVGNQLNGMTSEVLNPNTRFPINYVNRFEQIFPIPLVHSPRGDTSAP